MRPIYRGLPKPGHAVFDAQAAGAAQGGTQVRSPFFRRYLGVENVLVPAVGHDVVAGVPTPRPVVILTDLLAAIAGGPGGLCEESFDERTEAPWLSASRLLCDRLAERRIVTVLPADQHLNPALLDAGATTAVVLDPRALLPAERAVVAAAPTLARKLETRVALTVAEVEQVFGAIIDKEDRNFLPHCREGVVDYIPSVRALLDQQRDQLGREAAAGATLPRPWLLPDFKTGLSCLSAPDRRGMNGNALREILLASQAGAYLEGSARRHHKVALVGGTAHEYSVAEAVRFLVDLDYTVVLMLAVTGGLGIASKRATAHELCERYGAKVFASYDWPLPAHLGPEPPGWARLAARVRKEDDEFHQAWAVEHAAQLGRGRTSQDVPVVRDGRDLAAQLGRAS
ncbi:MAG: hypothetical protein IT370_24540 [Deltaproteobacteria bacterium]|nr:hypothetical protein [Deltaproteobacteria bacterium]